MLCQGRVEQQQIRYRSVGNGWVVDLRGVQDWWWYPMVWYMSDE